MKAHRLCDKVRIRHADERGRARARAEGFDNEIHLLCYLVMDCWPLKCMAQFLGVRETFVTNRLKRWGLKSLRKKGGRRKNSGQKRKLTYLHFAKSSKKRKPVSNNIERCPACGGMVSQTAYADRHKVCIKCGIEYYPEEQPKPKHPDIIKRVDSLRQ